MAVAPRMFLAMMFLQFINVQNEEDRSLGDACSDGCCFLFGSISEDALLSVCEVIFYPKKRFT